MEKAYELININPSLSFVAELGSLQLRLAEIDFQLRQKEVERQNLESTESEFYNSKGEIKSLIARLKHQGKMATCINYGLRSLRASKL